MIQSPRPGSGGCPRPFRGARLAALLLFASALGARPAFAQDRHTPREVKQMAMSALQAGAYEDAILHLTQWIHWYGESTDPGIVAELEDVYYNLGLCHLLLGQFGSARETFDTYLRKYRLTARSRIVAIFVGDSWRYEKQFPEAMRAYHQALRTYQYEPDLETDILCSQVRCIIAGEDWNPAEPLLLRILTLAPDRVRRNWAASILTVLYLRDLAVEKVYDLMPILLQPGSFASRSVVLNMTALETGDELFSTDRYRDALWIYRLVYPYDVLMFNAQSQKEATERRMLWLRRTPGAVRQLLRAQETLMEIEAEIEALRGIPIYDPELFFRMASCYMQIKRFREGGDLFYDLYLDQSSEFSEEALNLAFLCGTKIHPMDRAFARGEEYMDAYPGGFWYDDLSLHLGQLYADQRDWPNVLRVLRKAIEVHPEHTSMVECLYLLGYASFMEEQFDAAAAYLTQMNTRFPGNDREPDGFYWIGMARMFEKEFEAAGPFFERVVHDFPGSIYVEDAFFRSASCDFGASKFEDAEEKLLRFVVLYPESRLLGEAYLILGDISGQFGDLEEAVRRFRRSLEYPMNIELYNHAYFRSGEMMRDLAGAAKEPGEERRWREAIVSHFQGYLEDDREEANRPLAVYWIGSALWDLGEMERALVLYQDTVEQYGEDRFDLGVDLIFEHWVGQSRNAPAELAEGAWRDLRGMLSRAIQQERWALALRVQRILVFDPRISDREKEILRESLLRDRNLAHASPGVLEWILREAAAAGMRDLSIRAARTMVDDFPETDYALSAREALAGAAVEDGHYDEALRHLTVIREVYASSPQAGPALLKIGEIHLERRELDAADRAFTDLTGERDWRALWPAAVFGRGQVAEERRRFQEAAAFYERIYVMYSGYEEWADRAYLARSRVLRRLQEFSKAREVIQELLEVRRASARGLAEEEFEALPSVRQAREELDLIQRRAR